MLGMESWADQQVAILRADHEQWDIWFVPRYMVGYTWHARRKGTEIASVNAESPEDLDQALTKEERNQK